MLARARAWQKPSVHGTHFPSPACGRGQRVRGQTQGSVNSGNAAHLFHAPRSGLGYDPGWKIGGVAVSSVLFNKNVAGPAGSAPESPVMGRLPRRLSEREMALFTGVGQRLELGPGRAVFRRGEFGRSMFVIASGRVLLEFAGDLPDKLIGPDEYFGELALFVGNHARSGSALASEPCVVYVIEPDTFEALLRSEPLQMAQFMLRSFTYLVASEQQLIANY